MGIRPANCPDHDKGNCLMRIKPNYCLADFIAHSVLIIETKSDNPNSSSITTLQNSTTQIIFWVISV